MTGVALLLWRARLRASLRPLAVLVLLTALGGGVALSVGAGARRTAGANDAVLDLTHAYEVSSSYASASVDEVRQRVAVLPAVDDFTQVAGFLTVLPENPVPGLTSFGFNEDRVVVERPVVIEGRLPTAIDEVFLNEEAAAQTHASVGDPLEVAITDFTYSEFVPATMVVVGVGMFPDEVYEDEMGAKPTVTYSKPFVDAHRDLIAWGAIAAALAPGATPDDAVAQLLEAGFAVDNVRSVDRGKAWNAIRPLVVTLGVLALLAGLATIVVVGQALHRLLERSPSDARSLAASGCSRAMLRAADVGIAATVGALGAIGAVGIAVAASPLFPQGRARRIQALRGVDVDLIVLGAGASAVMLALVLVVAARSLRWDRAAQRRPGRAPGLLGVDPAIGTGVRFASGRRGLAGTVGGVAVGLTAVVAAVVFTGSMERLVSRPELAGFNWDLLGRNTYAVIDTAAVADQLRDDPAVERVTGVSFVDLVIDGVPVPGSAWAALEGSPWPSLTSGRAPEGPNEMLFSERTLAQFGYEVGDTVEVGYTGTDNEEFSITQMQMTIVGTAVSPAIALAGSDTPRLDTGVLVRRDDIASLDIEYGTAMAFDLAAGADPGSVRAQFPNGLPDDIHGPTEWFETARPAEVIQANDAVDVLVLAIGALLIGVMATVAHSLLAFVRDRRSAFAVLKALGFTPRQLRSTVLWQSGLVVGAALLVAVPLGIAAGRWLYQGFAGGIGVIVEPVVPPLALSAAAVAAVGLVQAVALLPASRARRTDAATELRSE